jgi:hypothetical protein
MLEFHTTAKRSMPAGGFHEAVRNPLTSARIDRWRNEMSPGDLRVFEAVAGSTLAELGYQPAGEQVLSGAERLRISMLSAKYLLYRVARRLAERLGLLLPN